MWEEENERMLFAPLKRFWYYTGMKQYMFNNYGGSYQLSIEQPEDLKKVLDLDEALWAATSLPIDILNVDKKFLEYLDRDCNGRIRTDEIIQAIEWLFSLLMDYSHLAERTDILLFDSINIAVPEGKRILETATIILSNLNEKNNLDRITLAQVRDLQGILARSTANGDGIITPDATPDKDLADFIRLIMERIGCADDASGSAGIDGAHTKEFFSQVSSYLAWREKGKIPSGQEKTDIMFWGTDTPGAYLSLKKVEEKLDEFFAQCAVAQFDARVKNALQLKEKEIEEMDFADTALLVDRLRVAPLSEINNAGILPLNGYINPFFAEAIKEFKNKVLIRLFGKEVQSIREKEWKQVQELFSPYKAYVEDRQGEKVEGLDEEVLRNYLEGSFQEKIEILINRDLAVGEKIAHIRDVEKLILYQKFLMEFANNSASFANVYNPDIRSLFEAGTLVIDGRKIPFTILVNDPAAHRLVAEDSNAYLLYLLVTSKHNEDASFHVVAPVTSGDSGTLRIGKRGVFFTRDGKEWDAEVIDIVVNPIGLLESIKAPFIKLSDSIKNQVEKFAKSKEAKIESALASPPIAPNARRDLLIGGGVAVAALGSSFAYIARAISQVRVIHFVITLGAVLLIILIPSLVMGMMKLRRRNLSILFEASGCAMNMRMKLTIGLGRLFTFVPPYPARSEKRRLDTVAELAKQIRSSQRVEWERVVKVLLVAIGLFLLFFFSFIFYYMRQR